MWQKKQTTLNSRCIAWNRILVQPSVGAAGSGKQGRPEWHALPVWRRALLLHCLLCSLSLGDHRSTFPLSWRVWCLHGKWDPVSIGVTSLSASECALLWLQAEMMSLIVSRKHSEPPKVWSSCLKKFCFFLKLCFVQSGHGEQEDFNGHDAEGGCQSALQTVHFPYATEYEVFTDASLSSYTCIFSY